MCRIFQLSDDNEISHIKSIKTKFILQLEEMIQNYSIYEHNTFGRLASILGLSANSYSNYYTNNYIIYKVIEYYLNNQFNFYTFKQFVSILNS